MPGRNKSRIVKHCNSRRLQGLDVLAKGACYELLGMGSMTPAADGFKALHRHPYYSSHSLG